MQVTGSKMLVYIGKSGDSLADWKNLVKSRKTIYRSEAFSDLGGDFCLARLQG